MTQWNNIYKEKGTKYEFYNIIEPHKDMPKVVNIFKEAGVNRVLDLGCGAGRNLFPLAESGFVTYGIDMAEEGLEIAKGVLNQKGLTADLRVGDVFERLPYEDNYFDAIISVQVLQHATPERIKEAIDEIHRMLKPKGQIFVTLTGRLCYGTVHRILILTAKKVAPHQYIPQTGDEKGLIHFIYTKHLIHQHDNKFNIRSMWNDEKSYYCFIAEKKI